jgi:DNA-binding NtrC family response regulator
MSSKRSAEADAVLLLVIDDDPQSLELVSAALESLKDLEIVTTTDPEQGLEIVQRRRPQIVLLDLMMPKLGGMEVLERILHCHPVADVILMTGHYSSESAVEAIQKGACDYLNKPVSIEKLRQRVAALIENARRWDRASQLDRELLETYFFQGLVGRSPRMLDVFSQINRIAPHFRTALVTGETGTGKELVAQALHHLSPCSRGPFVVCNCSAIVDTLFESELFGHVRGAFTGAVQDKMGLVEHANGGTIFLDEIGEIPLSTQAKLLRVVQNREIQRVGSPSVRTVDVRILAATNRDLRSLAATKQFREDLYYRLSMIELRLPSLSQRKEDLPLLQRNFIERFSAQYRKPIRALTRRAQALLASYSWPGNVRELENVLGHGCMMVESDMIDVRDLPAYLSAEPSGDTRASDRLLTLEEMHHQYAREVLKRLNGNKAKAAEILGVSRATLYRLLSDESLTSKLHEVSQF